MREVVMNTQPLKHGYPHIAKHEVHLFQIASQMKAANLPDEFIAAAIHTALEYEGVSDLIIMWANESDPDERSEIISDIQDMINACSQASKEEYPSIKLSDLDAIAKNIREFKDVLLELTNKNGGINRLAELTGIPQPSLSRFFNSNAMPRRGTLIKIGKALKLDAVKLATPWSR